MSWGAVALWVYGIGYVLALVPSARGLLRLVVSMSHPEQGHDVGDLWWAAGLGVVVAFLWPLGVPTFWVVERLRVTDPPTNPPTE